MKEKKGVNTGYRCSALTRSYLVATPLNSSQKHNQAGDAEETTDEIDSADDFLAAQPQRVGARRGEVEEDCDQQTKRIPRAGERADIAPVAVVGNELRVDDRWTERHDGEDESSDINATLAGGRHLRGGG